MKKKYTYLKISLLIRLLSLYALSSCVHTRQALNMHHIHHRHKNDFYPRNETTFNEYCIRLMPMALGAIWVIVCPLWIIISYRSRLPGIVQASGNNSNISHNQLNTTIEFRSIKELANYTTIHPEQLYEWNRTLNIALEQFSDNNSASLEHLAEEIG